MIVRAVGSHVALGTPDAGWLGSVRLIRIELLLGPPRINMVTARSENHTER